jgi:hypothetical protein
MRNLVLFLFALSFASCATNPFERYVVDAPWLDREGYYHFDTIQVYQPDEGEIVPTEALFLIYPSWNALSLAQEMALGTLQIQFHEIDFPQVSAILQEYLDTAAAGTQPTATRVEIADWWTKVYYALFRNPDNFAPSNTRIVFHRVVAPDGTHLLEWHFPLIVPAVGYRQQFADVRNTRLYTTPEATSVILDAMSPASIERLVAEADAAME